MTLESLAHEIRQLPLPTRLALIEIIAESVRQELAEGVESETVSPLTRRMLVPEGQLFSDQELKDDYINYLIQKNK